MSDHFYKVVELVGSSTSSIEDAIQTAIRRADQTVRNLRWFEVVQTRGQVERLLRPSLNLSLSAQLTSPLPWVNQETGR
jgi:flavin-binding protein dodecin